MENQVRYVKRTGASLPDKGLTHKKMYAVIAETTTSVCIKTDNKNVDWFDRSGFRFSENSVKIPKSVQVINPKHGIFCESKPAYCKCGGGKCINTKIK